MKDRGKFLTEALGGCWHRFTASEGHYCLRCNQKIVDYKQFYDFSTWQGFGILWEWAQEQEWFEKFLWFEPTAEEDDICAVAIQDKHPTNIINPDRFANAVYTFLKGRNK